LNQNHLDWSVGIPKVGIFFIIENQILMDAVPAKNGEPYGDTLGYGSHYEFWNNLVPWNLIEKKFKKRAYDAFPRGRVVFFTQEKKFVLYADKCLKQNKTKWIAEQFGLSDVVLKRDEHYQCAKCNRLFTD
jgi:hypothetical protein